jgi:hypothetical protein
MATNFLYVFLLMLLYIQKLHAGGGTNLCKFFPPGTGGSDGVAMKFPE